jgi:hypothetical protein
MRVWVSVPLVVLGIFAIVFGEADDSPGLQGIGLIVIISVVIFAFRSSKRK